MCYSLRIDTKTEERDRQTDRQTETDRLRVDERLTTSPHSALRARPAGRAYATPPAASSRFGCSSRFQALSIPFPAPINSTFVSSRFLSVSSSSDHLSTLNVFLLTQLTRALNFSVRVSLLFTLPGSCFSHLHPSFFVYLPSFLPFPYLSHPFIPFVILMYLAIHLLLCVVHEIERSKEIWGRCVEE